jgi:collagen type VII alpha
MSTSRPFAYNTGSTIDGTEQVGDIAIGTDITQPYGANYGGVQWWAGPDEDLGYVICKPISAGNQPNPLNIPCYIGFERSEDLTDQSFINLANAVFPGNNFTTASGAKSWMDSNGYWSSYVGATGSTGATGFTVTLVESGSNVVMTASGSLNINDLTLVASSTGPFGSGGIGVNSATWLISNTGQSADQYSGFSSSPSNFGSGSGAPASSITGDIIGVVFNGAPPYLLTVPVGYTTGTPITASQTFSSQSFASMGLVEGTYTYTWGTGPNADSINVVVGGTGATGSTGGTGGTGGVGGTGDFNVTITQVGPNVVWSGSGSFNLDSLTLVGSTAITSGFNASTAIWIAGASTTPPGPTGQQYGGASLTYPTTFLSGAQTGGPSATTGSMFGVVTGGASGRVIVVPDGYVSGTTISGSTTYANQTIAGMGLSGGTYVWAWGSAPNTSTLVMTIE